VLELDGAAGGGQLLRTALSLAAFEGRAFRMTGIREDRPTSGLRPQHLACVEAAAALTDATVEGDAVGSATLAFEPTRPPEGDVTVDVGTAGSLALVFDTVLPLAVGIDAPVSVTASGGTDVKWAPTLDYLRRVKLPLLARYGLAADVVVERRGFYPVGGGRATLHIAPSSLRPLTVERRGGLVAAAHAVAGGGLDRDVAERALDRVHERLAPVVPVAETTAAVAATDCPGFVLLVSLRGGTRAGFDAVGERGVPAEDVADDAVEAARAWLDGPGAVDDHLADQLVVPLALAGGAVRVPRRTAHLRTNRGLVETFGYEFDVDDGDDGDDGDGDDGDDGGGVVLAAPSAPHDVA
jgi:RNA 3'-terminal phosphate cyclase (ATP)